MAASACYKPDPAEGLPCSVDSRDCPDGQACGSDNVCRAIGSDVPAPDAESCEVAACQLDVLVSELGTADQLAVTPDHVFWTSSAGGQVSRTAKLDFETRVIDSADDPYNPLGIAGDGTSLYWSDSRTSGAIRSSSAVGDDQPVNLVGGQDFALYVAIDEDFVYWTNDGGLVLRASRSGGGVAMVAASRGDGPAGGLVIRGDLVYFADTGGGRIYVTQKDGSADLEVIAANQLSPLGVAVDDTYAYWTSTDSGEVKRRSLAGGPVEVIAAGQDGPSWIALGPRHVYWTNRTGNAVMSANTATRQIKVVAESQDGPNGLVLDGDALYWVNQAGPNRLLRTYPCACR